MRRKGEGRSKSRKREVSMSIILPPPPFHFPPLTLIPWDFRFPLRAGRGREGAPRNAISGKKYDLKFANLASIFVRLPSFLLNSVNSWHIPM